MKPKIVTGDISKVKQERIRRGWSQETMCKLADISPKTLRKLEKKELDNINVSTLKKVAAIFNIDMVTLFFL